MADAGRTDRDPDPRDATVALRVLGLIDLTDLSDDRSADGIDDLCARARAHGTAAVCVWSEHVHRCARLLDGSPVQVATVVNFPRGGTDAEPVVDETRRALADGANEIDVVLPYRSVIAGDDGAAASLLTEVRAAVEAPALLKVILETGELADEALIARAGRIGIEAGADFLKTSTGKTPIGATLPAAEVMLETIRDAGGHVGLKPSGGIRTVADAAAYLALADRLMGDDWVSPATFRFGASGLLDDVLRIVAGAGPGGAAGEY